MKNPFKLSSSESLVKSYRLFEARKNTQTSNVSLFVTNKRVIVFEEVKDLLGVGKRVHEYGINDIDDIYTNVQRKIDIIPAVVCLIITIFLFLSLAEAEMYWPGIVALVITVAVTILAFVFPKSSGILRIKSKSNRFVISEVTSMRQKLVNVGLNTFKYSNVKRSKDFSNLQFELGAIIKEIQEQNAGTKIILEGSSDPVSKPVEVKPEVQAPKSKKEVFDDIPEL